MDYIEELEKNILKSEGMLCGLILKQPDILLDYTINKKLLSEDALFYIGVVNKLLEKGVNVIDEVSFTNEIDLLDLKDKYEELGGYKTIKELMDVIDERNSDSIIENHSKWNLVKKYKDKGILDLEKLWDKVSLMTSVQIIDFIEYQLNDNDIEISGDIIEENLDLTDSEIQDLVDGINMGVDFSKHCPTLNYLTMGLPKSDLTMIASYTNGGKSSFTTNSIIIPTAESGEKVAVISNEQRSLVYKLLLLTYVLTEKLDYWKLSRKKIKSGQWSDEDKKYIKKAREIIKNEYSPYIKFYKVFDYDMKKINKIAKRFSKIGGDVLVYDTMKADTSENDSTWLALLNDSKELFQIVSKNNLAGVVTFQLALSTKNKVRILDEGVLSNGKQVAEVFSEMIGFRDIWSDEFSGEDSDIKPYKINYKTKEKEDITIKKGDGHSYKIFFHFKTRNDEVGTQLLYRFDGYQNKWIELGKCNVCGKNRY